MAQQSADSSIHLHGPDNAENEIRKAYDCVIETGVSHFWDKRAIPGVNADEVVTIYKHSLNAYRQGSRLAAERWARTAKHLGRAFWHEAKIAFLEPRISELPYLGGASKDELRPHENADTVTDLLDSAAHHIPADPDSD